MDSRHIAGSRLGQVPQQAQQGTGTAATAIYRVVPREMVMDQMQLATELQLPHLAARTSQQAAQQSVTQLMSEAARRGAEEQLRQALRDSMIRALSKVHVDVQQAAWQAVHWLLDANSEPLIRDVILRTADDKRRSALDPLATQQGRGGTGTSLQLSMADAMQTSMLDSYREAVTVMSHYALHDAVTRVLQDRVPAIVMEAVNDFSQRMLRVLHAEELQPAVQTLTLQTAQQAAAAAACDAIQRALRLGESSSLPVAEIQERPPPQTAAPSAQSTSVPTPTPRPPLIPRPSGPFGAHHATTITPPLTPAPLRGPAFPPRKRAFVPSPSAAVGPSPVLADEQPTAVIYVPEPPASKSAASSASAPAASSDPAPASPGGAACPATDGEVMYRTKMFLPDPDTGLWRTVSITLPADSFSTHPGSEPADENKENHISMVVIESLPDETLLRILGYVDPVTRAEVAAKVSRRWRRLALHDVLWKRQTLRYEARQKGRFAQLLRVAPQLAMVDCEKMSRPLNRKMSARPVVPSHVTQALLHTSCCVRGLRLATFDLEPSYVMAVLRKHGHNLDELDLTASDSLFQNQPQDKTQAGSELFTIIDALPRLKKLRLAGSYPCEYTFSPRVAHVPRRVLEYLDLEWYEAPSQQTASSLISVHSATLSSVRLSSRVTAEELINLSLCSQLRKMAIPCEAMRDFVPKLPSLVKLTLTQWRTVNQLNPQVRYPGALLMPFLQALVLYGVVEVGAIPECVRVAFPHIKAVTFQRTHMIKDFLPLIRQMSSLERLCFDEEPELTSDLFLGLREAAPKLRCISVLRSVRCAGTSCWQPITKYLAHYWPDATIKVDLPCTCEGRDDAK